MHVAVAVTGGCFFFLFWLLGHQGVGGQQEGGDAGGIAERSAYDLGRVDDAHGHEVAVFFALSVESVRALSAGDFGDDDRAFVPGVVGDLTHRLFQGAPHDADASVLAFGLAGE